MAKNSHLEIFQGGDFNEFAERLTFHFLASDIGKVPPSVKLEEKQAAIKKQAASVRNTGRPGRQWRLRKKIGAWSLAT